MVLGFAFLTIEQCSLLINTLAPAFVQSEVFAESVRILDPDLSDLSGKKLPDSNKLGGAACGKSETSSA